MVWFQWFIPTFSSISSTKMSENVAAMGYFTSPDRKYSTQKNTWLSILTPKCQFTQEFCHVGGKNNPQNRAVHVSNFQTTLFRVFLEKAEFLNNQKRIIPPKMSRSTSKYLPLWLRWTDLQPSLRGEELWLIPMLGCAVNKFHANHYQWILPSNKFRINTLGYIFGNRMQKETQTGISAHFYPFADFLRIYS